MILNKTYKIPKIFYKEEVRENSLYLYCMNFFFSNHLHAVLCNYYIHVVQVALNSDVVTIILTKHNISRHVTYYCHKLY